MANIQDNKKYNQVFETSETMTVRNEQSYDNMFLQVSDENASQKPHEPSLLTPYKEAYLRWLFVMMATIVSYIAIALIIIYVYTPDIELLKEEAAKITFMLGNPEPMERLLFQLALIFIPSCILFFYWISKKKMTGYFGWIYKFDTSISVLCVSGIAILAYYAFTAPNPNYTPPQSTYDIVASVNWEFYQLSLKQYFFVYLLGVFPLFLTLFFVLFDRLNWDANKRIQTIFSIATWCILGLLLVVIVSKNSFEFPYTSDNKYDFNAVYYSAAQVYGGSPMLVDGLSNTYGLYAQMLNPIFQITGLTPLSFSTVMAILLGLCFIFQTYFLLTFTNNKLLALLACLSLVFYPYLIYRLILPFDCIFSMFPIRWIIFSTLLIIAALYINHRKKVWYFTGSIILSFMVLWNPEIGMVSFMAWLAMLAYMNFYTPEKKLAYARIAKLIVGSLTMLVVAFVVYAIMIKLFYGVFPDFFAMFRMIFVFGSLGFGMLPMSMPHPWMLIVIIYVAGFVYSLTKLFDKIITPKSGAVFLLSMLGSGLFMYFVGRSHNWNLLPFLGIAFMLLAILGDDLWVATKTSRLWSYRIIFAVIVFVLTFASVEMLLNPKDIWTFADDSQAKTEQTAEEESIRSNQQFIKSNTSPHEKIFVLTSDWYQGLYFPPNKNRSAVNPGFIELVLNNEMNAYLEAIRDSSFTVFIEPNFFNFVLSSHIIESVAATYEFEKQNGSMFMLKKRAGRDSYYGVLENDNAIVYEFFSNDIIGFYKRMGYMQGSWDVKSDNKITVEVIFKPTPQLYPYAVLLGNQKNDTGFTLCCVDQQDTYGIAIADQIASFKVNLNEVNYLAISIHERTITIYLNGKMLGNVLFNNTLKPSDAGLHIGNYPNFMRFFLGEIREFCISAAQPSEDEMKKKWELINP